MQEGGDRDEASAEAMEADQEPEKEVEDQDAEVQQPEEEAEDEGPEGLDATGTPQTPLMESFHTLDTAPAEWDCTAKSLYMPS